MLWAVLVINAALFAVALGARWQAGSSALPGDSLDRLGDAMGYGLSLFAVTQSVRWPRLR